MQFRGARHGGLVHPLLLLHLQILVSEQLRCGVVRYKWSDFPLGFRCFACDFKFACEGIFPSVLAVTVTVHHHPVHSVLAQEVEIVTRRIELVMMHEEGIHLPALFVRVNRCSHQSVLCQRHYNPSVYSLLVWRVTVAMHESRETASIRVERHLMESGSLLIDHFVLRKRGPSVHVEF